MGILADLLFYWTGSQHHHKQFSYGLWLASVTMAIQFNDMNFFVWFVQDDNKPGHSNDRAHRVRVHLGRRMKHNATEVRLCQSYPSIKQSKNIYFVDHTFGEQWIDYGAYRVASRAVVDVFRRLVSQPSPKPGLVKKILQTPHT